MLMEVWIAVHLVATVVVSGCFVLSGIAKLRDPEGTAETFHALGVPRVLDRRWVHRLYPWIELAVGIGVLLAPAPLWWPVALVAAAMLSALTWFVGRVVASESAVSCNCFGSRQPVTRRTLARNIVFLAFAIVLLIASPLTTSPALAAVPQRLPLLLGVILAAVAGVVLADLSRGGESGEEAVPNSSSGSGGTALWVPGVEVRDPSGETVLLPAVVTGEPTLLVLVKPGCGPCQQTVKFFEGRERIAGRIVVHLMERTPPTGVDPSRRRLWDDGGIAAESLGLDGAPAALLVAGDRTIPADPVFGLAEIRRLVAGLEEAVAQSEQRR
ncbi:MAG: MauE/DoxX family redox-associated membrane protein [Leucobacter sp.]